MVLKSLLIAFILFGFIHGEPMNEVVKSTSAAEHAEPSQSKKDFKTWRNLLGYYAGARKQAKAALADLQSVSNLAWSTQKQLAAIERASQRVEFVLNNIESFRIDNPVQVVKDLELGVFQQTDALFYSDIPALKEANSKRIADRKVLSGRIGDRISSLNKLSVRAYKGFRRSMGFYTDPIQLKNNDFDKNDPDKMLFQHTSRSATTGLASSRLDAEKINNNSSQLSGLVAASTSNDVNGNPLAQSELIALNNENQYSASLEKHKYINKTVELTSWMLVRRSKYFEGVLNQNALFLKSLEGFSDELIRKKKEVK